MRWSGPLRSFRGYWGLPLLWKELQEQSARPRTYVIRFVYGALLFTLACAIFYGNLGDGGSADVLGRGRGLLHQLLTVQLWAMYLFVPAMVSGTITVEKERSTFDMLLTTKLRPWEIVFQKLIGRLVPVFTFLLLALPLMAIAYSFGGVTQAQLWTSIALLLLTCVQIGSLSIMCSAYFRSTPEAFVASYLAFPILATCCLPAAFTPNLLGETAAADQFAALTVMILPLAISTAVFLGLAIMFVTTRAHVAPRNWLLEMFKVLDGIFNEANSITGGVVLVKDEQTLPEDEPIAWRETAKKTLGTFRYQFRVLVAMELPVLFACQLLRTAPSRGEIDAIRTLLYLIWAIGTGMVAVHASSVISSERSRQTLDVLLSTPLSAHDIIRQKFRGVRRLMGVLLVPFLTVFLFEAWWDSAGAWLYLLLSLLAVLIYLPLIAWMALWIGLRVRSQTKALILATCAIVIWAGLPWAAEYLLANLFGVRLTGAAAYLRLLSPASVIPAIESRDAAAWGLPESAWVFYTLNFLLYAGLLLVFHRLCLHDADRTLGRMPDAGTERTDGQEKLEPESARAGGRTWEQSAIG